MSKTRGVSLPSVSASHKTPMPWTKRTERGQKKLMILLNLWLKKTISYSVCSFIFFVFVSINQHHQNCFVEEEMTPLALQHPLFWDWDSETGKKCVIAVLAFYLFNLNTENIIYDLSTFDTSTKHLE